MMPRVVCSHYRVAPAELGARGVVAKCLDCGAELVATPPAPPAVREAA